jgi:hypothetical protein
MADYLPVRTCTEGGRTYEICGHPVVGGTYCGYEGRQWKCPTHGRVARLSKMPKRDVVREFVRVVGRPLWSLHPIEKWSKDELIADILRAEGLA